MLVSPTASPEVYLMVFQVFHSHQFIITLSCQPIDTLSEYFISVHGVWRYEQANNVVLVDWLTRSEYSVDIRLIRQHHSDNIEWTVGVTNGYTR
jgi:hypothetical protein